MANKSLSIYYQNVRGLRTKCAAFQLNLLSNNYDIVVITETWLCDGIFDREIADDRYVVFRQDRNLTLANKKTGGGVMMLVRRELGALSVAVDDYSGFEVVIITIPAHALAATADLQVITVYLQPDPARLPSNIDCLVKIMESLYNLNTRNNYLLIGDFNLPCVGWNNYVPNYLKNSTTEVQNSSMDLVESITFLGMKQYNLLQNYAVNTLDLAFSNLPLIVTGCRHPLLRIDKAHPPFTVNILDLNITPLVESTVPKPNYRKGNYDSLNKYFSELHWETILNSDTIDGMLDNFYSCINESISKHIPFSKRCSNNRKYPVWFSSALINIVKEKSKAHKLWKRFNNYRDYSEFCMLHHRQKQVQRLCYDQYICGVQNSIKVNSKAFWSYIKCIRGSSNYPKIMTYNSRKYVDGQSICEAFNVFFQSVFGTSSDTNFTLDLEHTSASDSISKLHIDKNMVEKFLLQLDVNKGARSDSIPLLF
ncbi:unnamed protein product [Euphydryas editha]|uniref:Endonuclease/exonuclease/phosphatase domain-containing protein n=1 Tax=Euphydryas editha TaxID=104508 RepID=A0AAU9TTG6_EUPED|nr:unnamed protein product [Euphydryas editha]